MTDRVDMPGVDTTGVDTNKIKRKIHMSAIRCRVCGKWECPEFDHELYDAIITGETYGICSSCRKAILWAKEQMRGL